MELIVIQKRIYEIRGHRVMLDFDLALLYETETKYLKRAVRQNIKRFPPDFMFELTKEEFENLRCNFSTSNKVKNPGSQHAISKRGGTRYLPFAFTEHGVAMLSGILNSDKALDMNIAIIKAFIAMKQLISRQNEVAQQLQELRERLGEHDIQLNQIYDAIENLLDEKIEKKKWEDRDRIGFKPDK
jgi:phage regulator Rha-like protein